MYSVAEKVFWVQKYLSGSTFREVCDKFQEEYPDLPKPNCSTVKRCYDRFVATGNVQYERKGKPHRHEESMNRLVVLASVAANPHRSSSAIVQENRAVTANSLAPLTQE